MRVACVQIRAKINDKNHNISTMKSYIDKTIEEYPNTDLIIFPELALTGYECTKAEAKEVAETIDGESIKEMAQYAANKNIHLIFGFIEKNTEKDALHIAAAMIDSSGKILGSYKKMHMVDTEREIFTPGDSYPVFETDLGKIGIMICWDAAFPETARILALKGADLIAVPSAWESPMQDDWDFVQKARAFDNVIYTACCNQVGKERNLEFFGRSKISGPLGQVCSDIIDDEEAIITAEITLSDKDELRDGYYPLLKDRRPETYEVLTEKY